jgi:hypothetical protein
MYLVDVTLKILDFSNAEENEKKIFKSLYIFGGHLALLNQFATWRAPRPFSSVRFGSIPVQCTSPPHMYTMKGTLLEHSGNQNK